MLNGKHGTIAYTNLIRALVVLKSHGKTMKVKCKMVSCISVWKHMLEGVVNGGAVVVCLTVMEMLGKNNQTANNRCLLHTWQTR